MNVSGRVSGPVPAQGAAAPGKRVEPAGFGPMFNGLLLPSPPLVPVVAAEPGPVVAPVGAGQASGGFDPQQARNRLLLAMVARVMWVPLFYRPVSAMAVARLLRRRRWLGHGLGPARAVPAVFDAARLERSYASMAGLVVTRSGSLIDVAA
jgi:hypothetical protein